MWALDPQTDGRDLIPIPGARSAQVLYMRKVAEEDVPSTEGLVELTLNTDATVALLFRPNCTIY